MIDIELALILVTALLIGAITGGLRLADQASWPSALIAAGTAAGATITIAILLI